MSPIPQAYAPSALSEDDASSEGHLSQPSLASVELTCGMTPPSPYPQAIGLSSSLAQGTLCAVCREPVRTEAAVRLQCGHTYDTSCIRTMYRRANTDESAYPPKCCKSPIAFSDVQAHLGPVLAAVFQRKEREYRTANRVYCHKRDCSTFLGGATTFPKPFPCPTCKSHTCTQCKQRAHLGLPCIAHDKDESVLRLGRENGWKRCPFCQHLIELDIGCYHVTCRCGKEFCYKCGVAWKGCNCDLFYVPPEDGVEAVGLAPRAAPIVMAERLPTQAPLPLVLDCLDDNRDDPR
ncbi:hypothetical protein GY45DRAFT_1316057 [Cubamyces sp. BRFM 1775]|nr:hypothetical protein GY45DRAFT_1316057 [Cubamyces sp. BRFM 1775]